MPFTRPSPARLMALGIALSLTVYSPTANESLPQSADAAQPEARASAGFVAALRLVVGGDAEQGFARAADLTDPAERRAIQWAAIHLDPEAVGPADILAFMSDAPSYGAPQTMLARLETALDDADWQFDLAEAYEEREPRSDAAKLALAKAELAAGNRETAERLARSLWTTSFLDEDQEAELLRSFGSALTAEDHWTRSSMLLMHDRIRAVERIAEHLTPAQVTLLEARAATARDQSDGRALLDQVDASLRTHPVYIFTRVQRAREADLFDQAADWLAQQPSGPEESTLWWNERRLVAEGLLAAVDAERAYEVAAGFSNGTDGRMVEAGFLAGFIALVELDDPERASAQFTKMASFATLPDSITQANFWLGRAEIARGDYAAADAAYGRAAQFPLVYYGQLARAELGLTGLPVRPLPDGPLVPTTQGTEMLRTVSLLADQDAPGLAGILLRQFGTTATAPGDRIAAARMAERIGLHNVTIAIADAAERSGMPMDEYSFTRAGLPSGARYAAERAAVFAVARQESLFQRDAVSHAGARGLMQLMPGTAREVAGQLGLTYTASRLTADPSYNVLLGSTYLNTQLDRYDGSLLLAAAAYNAGPGNANRWLTRFGDPRAGADPVVWVERIPFTETRKYVQRVLGNYMVYRHLLGEQPMTVADAMRSIILPDS
jgi:soluble lytic murein transglycosylase